MLFDLEIRAQAGTDYFQPFKTTVEAGTSSDALNRVKRQYPGCDVWVTNSYNAPVNRGPSGSSSGGGGCAPLIGLGILILIGGIFGGGKEKPADVAPTPAPAPIERVESAPQWKNYANPPGPCVTADFTPC